MKYFESLNEEDRETLFSHMRHIDQGAQRLEAEHRRLSPRYGQIAVGAGAFDPWLKSAVMQEYLSSLRKGQTPIQAKVKAIEYGRLCVQKHNEKRKDINWQRWIDSGTALAEQLYRGTPQPTTEEVSD